MRRWTAAMALVCAASVSALTLPLHAQPPQPEPSVPESDAPPTSAEEPSTEGASPSDADDPSSAGAASDAPGGATEAPPTETLPTEAPPTDAPPTDAAPTGVTPTDVPPTDPAASPAAPSAASAHRLAPPIAPPPPPVGFDDERAAPPMEDPRPRSALRERFVIFSPGWMPIVTLGYRAQIFRYTGGTVVRSDTSHGLTSGVLAPVLATGDSSSRVRLALGVGMGLDVAWRSSSGGGGFYIPPSPGFPAPPSVVERTTYVYGQLAAMLVVPLGSARALATMSWLPGKRFVRAEIGSQWPTLERARVSVGVLRVPFHMSAFAGVARVIGAADVELGVQLGMGW